MSIIYRENTHYTDIDGNYIYGNTWFNYSVLVSRANGSPVSVDAYCSSIEVDHYEETAKMGFSFYVEAYYDSDLTATYTLDCKVQVKTSDNKTSTATGSLVAQPNTLSTSAPRCIGTLYCSGVPLQYDDEGNLCLLEGVTTTFTVTSIKCNTTQVASNISDSNTSYTNTDFKITLSSFTIKSADTSNYDTSNYNISCTLPTGITGNLSTELYFSTKQGTAYAISNSIFYRKLASTISGSNSYSINFTQTDLDTLYTLYTTKSSNTFYAYARISLITKSGHELYCWSSYQKLTIILSDALPRIDLEIKDLAPTATALSGNASVLIKHLSQLEYKLTTFAVKAAKIKTISLVGGDTVLFNSTTSITATEEAPFTTSSTGLAVTFDSLVCTVTDTRGKSASITIDIIPYIFPTIKLVDAKITGENGQGILTATIEGSVFNGSFGKTYNNLTLAYGLILTGEGDIENTLTTLSPGTLSSNRYSYTFEVPIIDYRYTNRYDFVVVAQDSVSNKASTPVVVLAAIPLFDWGKEDFRFNIPIKLSETSTILLPDGTDLLQLLKTAGIYKPSN